MIAISLRAPTDGVTKGLGAINAVSLYRATKCVYQLLKLKKSGPVPVSRTSINQWLTHHELIPILDRWLSRLLQHVKLIELR
jgi:hypothetical protein